MKFYVAALILLIPLLQPEVSSAQWTRVDTNPGLSADFLPAGLANDGNALFALSLEGAPLTLHLYRSDDEGGTWTPGPGFPSGFPTHNFFAALDGRLTVAGIAADGSFAYFQMSDDGGHTWANIQATDIGGPLSVSRRGSSMFAVTTTGIARSVDDGASWSMTASSPQFPTSIFATNTSLLVMAGNGTNRSINGGDSWTQITRPGSINIFSAPWEDDGRIYMKDAATAMIHESDDDGATWQSYTSFSDLGWSLALPVPESDLWMAFAAGVETASFFTTDDRAVTATTIALAGYPTMADSSPCAAFPTVTPSSVFVCSNLCFNDQNGVYRHDLSTQTSVEDGGIPKRVEIGAPYPNPVVDRVSIPVTLSASAEPHLEVVDMLGRTVGRASFGRVSAGSRTLDYDMSALPPGSYAILVRPEGTSVPESRIIVRLGKER